MDLVVITIGRENPVPCLAEAYRLSQALHSKQGQTIVFPRFLAVASRRDEVDAIQRILKQRLESGEGQPISLDWRYLELSEDRNEPHQPDAIYQKVTGALKAYRDITAVHCPYTGGTKAMAVHVLEAARDHFEVPVHASYLSIRTHRMEGRTYNYYTSGLVDERLQWTLSFAELAMLHGIEYKGSSGPDEELSALARDLLAIILRGDYRSYLNWLNGSWKKEFRGGGYKDVRIEELDSRRWPRCSIPWFQPSSLTEEWISITHRIVDRFGKGAVWERTATGGWNIKVDLQNKPFLVPMYHFLDNRFLEMYAYRCLRELLPDDYAVAHSLVCQEIRMRRRPFELDVTAVLGYQLVAVSCVFSNRASLCKDKAFEVLHRARQLGGDHARAVVLCLLDRNGIEELESDLEDNRGLPHQERPLRLFGKETLDDAASSAPRYLKNAFGGFLEQLGWRSFKISS